MVKKKSRRFLNPADAHRKAMRQKEIKKNKMERKRVRTLIMVHKDTTKLEEEITRYRSLDREKKLDKNGKAKLKDLEDKYKKICETKKYIKVSVIKDKDKNVKDQNPIHFHPTLNPSGLPASNLGQEESDNDENDSVSSEEEDEPSQNSDSRIPNAMQPPPTSSFPPSNGNHILRNGHPGLNNMRSNVMQPPPTSSFPSANGTHIMRNGHPGLNNMRPNMMQQQPPPTSPSSFPPTNVYGSSSRNFSQTNTSNKFQPENSSTLTATPVIQAAPKVRNLQKELTTFVPASLMRKKVSENKPKVARPVVNAAPNIDDGVSSTTTTTAIKRSVSTAIPLLQQSENNNLSSETISTPPPAKKSKTNKKKVDEYDKFMAEMQDLL
ncbi:1663_t:CDS:2 [Diversispora eburnea]|uniref:1663_t:CDS:1 n=1 Tax=Diversispora eburnea TaxID=1213867 RepID=A0A9N8Z6Q0_9GLOM|nr:1663_t:CDS:2 [Diversispora eburnea]